MALKYSMVGSIITCLQYVFFLSIRVDNIPVYRHIAVFSPLFLTWFLTTTALLKVRLKVHYDVQECRLLALRY